MEIRDFTFLKFLQIARVESGSQAIIYTCMMELHGLLQQILLQLLLENPIRVFKQLKLLLQFAQWS